MSYFPEDPTATEVAEELAKRRRQAEVEAEIERRKEWDDAHGPIKPEEAAEYVLKDNEVEGKVVQEELERGDG